MTATVGLVLSGDGKDTAREIGDALKAQGGLAALGVGLGGLSRGAQSLVHQQVSGAVAGVLNLSLADVLVKAWRTHAVLSEAARATQAEPGTTRVVDLATHRVTCQYRPVVDVVVNGVVAASLALELSLVLDIVALAGAVSGGRLVALRGGECHVTAALGAAGRPLLQRSAKFDLNLVVELTGERSEETPLLHR